MPSEEDNTALAAIIIAVIAFFVTTGQLLQQIFGTADGYRHCQASVIGDWATLTRRKWRWSEFRFETKFTTPNIRLIDVEGCARLTKVRLITGDLESRRRTHVTSIRNTDDHESGDQVNPDDDESGDQVGWLALLDQLHLFQENYRRKGITPNIIIDNPMLEMNCPAITLRERSWDLIPPDIIRPVATSTVGDIIALAHRLGMGWNDLRPGDGIMRAEGSGRSIVSTAVRGFGVLLQFNYEPAKYDVSNYNGTVPSMPADKLGFGIIESGLGLGDIEIESTNETEAAKEVMRQLGIDRAVISTYSEYMEQSGNSLGFSDILGMWAPFMTLPGSSVVRVMKVLRDVDRGPICSREGFVAFHLRLEKNEKEGACSEQMLYLLNTYRKLKEKWGLGWEVPTHGGRGFAASPEFLSEIRKLWSEVADRFGEKHSSTSPFLFFHVLKAHIKQAIEYPLLAKAALNDTAQRKNIEEGLGPSMDPMDLEMAAGMHLYIDRIPLVVSSMKEEGIPDERLVIDAWWTLVFRAMLWHRGHAIIEGKTRGYGGIPVSPSFWESKLPVYIA